MTTSTEDWLIELAATHWLNPCVATVRPYAPNDALAQNLCTATMPMIAMFTLVGIVGTLAYFDSRRGAKEKTS